MYKEKLEQQIEELRIRMYELYNNNPADEELVRISQELDGLLNRFRKRTADVQIDMNRVN
ncbi:Spo0E family sporulation regulatory protein-aspartic acid phosphatase [Halobacillus sp. H74]|uniref:Spo0E family sporulation regulatory protein-aspartic acid phosphatase n=1 Tax=Halobacillus sp. H74 TaxID=3457436 RepID=UPI003FCCDF43